MQIEQDKVMKPHHYIYIIVIGVFLLACSKQITEPQSKHDLTHLTKLESSKQRAGDAEKGKEYLLYGGYVDSGVPLSLFGKFFNSTNDELQRKGIGAGIPHGFNAFTNDDGIDVVSPNCLQCHAGYIDGDFILGLGNTDADFTMNTGGMSVMLDAVIASTYGMDSPQWKSYERFSTAMKTTGPEIITDVVGANSADKIAAVLAAHRDQESLEWTDEEMILLPEEVVPTDVPPWWLLKKKHAMFYTGVGQGDYARISMASSVLTIQDTTKAREIDNHFADVIAFLYSLEAPEYKFDIDENLALKGESIFNSKCATCHGSYGINESYPNYLVDVELVDTDRALLSANFGYGPFVEWYNESWFGQMPNAAKLVPGNGYVAPPLDGIWATAPYLHNGSVPTIELLLNSSSRPSVWKKETGYNQEELGLNYQTLTEKEDKFTYDTSVYGYGNSGHRFGDKLSEQERSAVIEYLKTL
jgi:mono/diheme cytochrome c family protein